MSNTQQTDKEYRCEKHNLPMMPGKYRWEGFQGYICEKCTEEAWVKFSRLRATMKD
jgi:hypothetical protein